MAITTPHQTTPVSPEVHATVVDPFANAAGVTLQEMAATEAAVRTVYEERVVEPLGEVSATLSLTGNHTGSLSLELPRSTAETLARRILAGVHDDVNEELLRDCVGEIANVIAGQTKALCAGTPYHFTFSTPITAAGRQPPRPAPDGTRCIVIVFVCDAGEFAIRLCLDKKDLPAAS